jgi:hypothetical protein
MRTVSIHQPECFPWLGFLDKASRSDVFVLLDCVQYVKSSFQNRNKLRTRRGWDWVTVPVAMKDRSKKLISEIEISDGDGQRWRRKHLALWRENYRGARFAAPYLTFLEKLYAGSHRRLLDFNREVIDWLFAQFEIKAEVRLASQMRWHGAATELNLSLCQDAGADVYLSGISGRDYLDERRFKAAGIAVRYQEFHHPVYPQRFDPFVPGLSSLDLLFNHGPDAARILRDPAAPRLDTLFAPARLRADIA